MTRPFTVHCSINLCDIRNFASDALSRHESTFSDQFSTFERTKTRIVIGYFVDPSPGCASAFPGANWSAEFFASRARAQMPVAEKELYADVCGASASNSIQPFNMQVTLLLAIALLAEATLALFVFITLAFNASDESLRVARPRTYP